MLTRTQLVLIAMAAALAVGGIATSSASAVGFWQVEGLELEAGVLSEATIEGSEHYLLKGKAAGVNVEITCNKQTAKGANIKGGEQGTGEGKLELSECTVPKPTKCAVAEPITASVKAELVENTSGETLYVRFLPKEGKTFTTIELKNKGSETCALAERFAVEGSVAAELSPQTEEAEKDTLHFPSSPIKNVLSLSGTSEETELTFDGNPATLTGTSTAALKTKQQMAGLIRYFRVVRPGEFATRNERGNVKINALRAATINGRVIDPFLPINVIAFAVTNINNCEKAYAVNQVCEVELEFTGANAGVKYTNLFGVHPMLYPANSYQSTFVEGEW
jgi:hypothetical protein